MAESRLRDLREDADMRQIDLARILNCTQACYSYYESGERDIPTGVLNQLADYYGTSIDYLLKRTDRREPYPQNK